MTFVGIGKIVNVKHIQETKMSEYGDELYKKDYYTITFLDYDEASDYTFEVDENAINYIENELEEKLLKNNNFIINIMFDIDEKAVIFDIQEADEEIEELLYKILK